jgi:hypothetical protein
MFEKRSEQIFAFCENKKEFLSRYGFLLHCSFIKIQIQVLTTMPFMRLSIPPLSRITRVKVVLEYLFLLGNLAMMTSIHQVSNSIKYLKSVFKSDFHRKLFLPNMLESNRILQHLLFNIAYISQS